jgi:hypothetical protein
VYIVLASRSVLDLPDLALALTHDLCAAGQLLTAAVAFHKYCINHVVADRYPIDPFGKHTYNEPISTSFCFETYFVHLILP